MNDVVTDTLAKFLVSMLFLSHPIGTFHISKCFFISIYMHACMYSIRFVDGKYIIIIAANTLAWVHACMHDGVY